MQTEELFSLLKSACASAAAIRLIIRLQPSGGAGDKVMPPTYEGGAYAFEQRFIDGASVSTVLLDSVQSQANRFEDALLEARRSGNLRLPLFEMKVAGHEVNTLNAPHRVHDAIFRDSLWDGKPFRQSKGGQRLSAARARNATAFLEYSPTVLLFGTWDSQSGGGVNSAKVARALVSEIVALDAKRGVKTSSRIDPLGIKLIHGVVKKTADERAWEFVEPADPNKKAKKGEGGSVRPSEVNHGNVTPSITDLETGAGGVTFREAIQTTVLSFAQLRKLRFPDELGVSSSERDNAGRSVIAALGLHAVTLLMNEGYQLRSRCQLVPMAPPVFELIGRTLQETEKFSVESSITSGALQQALDAAKSAGLVWHEETIRLEPRADLVKLVELSDRTVAEPEAKP